MPWHPYKYGETLGTKGSENGVIIREEEFDDDARITLEKDGYTPFGITCGVYGAFVHTAFAGNEQEATAKYEAMKAELALHAKDEQELDSFSDWIEEFTNKYI